MRLRKTYSIVELAEQCMDENRDRYWSRRTMNRFYMIMQILGGKNAIYTSSR